LTPLARAVKKMASSRGKPDTITRAGEALGDLFQFQTSPREWRKLQPSSAPAAASLGARYGMGFVAAGNNKIYLVGGKLSAWPSGTGSLYSWSDSVELDSEYGKDKGNDDVWELDYQADPPAWTRRVDSLYATMCSAEWTAGSASATFCENFLGAFPDLISYKYLIFI
jgi:hypothetical protein